MPANKETAKILVADDDPIILLILKEMFQKMHGKTQFKFHIKFVATGLKAISLCSTWEPDVLMLDFHLPDVEAKQILKQLEINKILKNTMVLLMTADTTEETALIGLSAGAQDIIYKPLRATELSLKLANLLSLRKRETHMTEALTTLESEKRIFSKFFSQDVMNKILEDVNLRERGGINTYASILFVDIRGSTQLAESLGPQVFAELLNIIFEDFSAVIHKNFGSINKFMGDGILATFGCPMVYDNDIYHCVRAAFQLEQSINEFNLVKPAHVKAEVKIGIGVASGKIFAGTIGSANRMEYTVLGDPVNVAHRLQSLTKEVGCTTIIDGETYEAVKNVVEVETLNFKHVRGRIGELDIYRLIGIKEDLANKEFKDQAETTLPGQEISDVEFF